MLLLGDGDYLRCALLVVQSSGNIYTHWNICFREYGIIPVDWFVYRGFNFREKLFPCSWVVFCLWAFSRNVHTYTNMCITKLTFSRLHRSLYIVARASSGTFIKFGIRLAICVSDLFWIFPEN